MAAHHLTLEASPYSVTSFVDSIAGMLEISVIVDCCKKASTEAVEALDFAELRI